MSLRRRFRAAAVLAVAWAMLWIPFAVVLYLGLAGAVDGFSFTWRDVLHLAMRGVLVGGPWGLGSGAIFAVALAAAERRGGIEHLAGHRVLGWGSLSGAIFPVIVAAVVTASMGGPGGITSGLLLAVTGVGALYGALVAAGLFAVARRATPT
jgi:hypothetical protein